LLRLAFLLWVLACEPAAAADGSAPAWRMWLAALFVASFAIGVVAVVAGVGGGVLFVPIVGRFFPFHLDFVRGAGLVFALAGTLAYLSLAGIALIGAVTLVCYLAVLPLLLRLGERLQAALAAAEVLVLLSPPPESWQAGLDAC
jgi:uncharacterized protein